MSLLLHACVFVLDVRVRCQLSHAYCVLLRSVAQELLGEGAFGKVFRAVHKGSKAQLAIKVAVALIVSTDHLSSANCDTACASQWQGEGRLNQGRSRFPEAAPQPQHRFVLVSPFSSSFVLTCLRHCRHAAWASWFCSTVQWVLGARQGRKVRTPLRLLRCSVLS